jgi:hypothetical protein
VWKENENTRVEKKGKENRKVFWLSGVYEPIMENTLKNQF